MKIDDMSENIELETHVGTWHILESRKIHGEKLFLLEHDYYGDMCACVIVNEDGKIILEDVWEMWNELHELPGYM